MRTRLQALAEANKQNTGKTGMCQFITRTWFDAPSVGDFDGDGASDAEDGWKKEPLWARRLDRHPMLGSPVAYLGGSNDNGHRAIYAGKGMIRGIDSPTKGRIGTVPLDWPEKNWGLKYAGWSLTMDGIEIPADPKPKPLTKGWRVIRAEKLLRAAYARPGSRRAKLLKQAADALHKVPETL